MKELRLSSDEFEDVLDIEDDMFNEINEDDFIDEDVDDYEYDNDEYDMDFDSEYNE